MSTNYYKLFDKYLIRFPAYPIENIITNENLEFDFFIDLFKNDNYFQNSIFLASYSFYCQLHKLVDENNNIDADKRLKLKIGLYKYYSRMCTRSTPFGLFAGVATGIFSDRTLSTFDPDLSRVHTQFDNFYLYNSVKTDFICNDEDIYLFANNTVIKYLNHYLYVEESINESGKKKFCIAQTKKEDILAKIYSLTKTGIHKNKLIHTIIHSNKQYSYEEIKSYINSLIENKFLFTDIEITVNENYFEKLKYIFSKTKSNQHIKNRLLQLNKIISNKLIDVSKDSFSLLQQSKSHTCPFKCTLTLENSEVSLNVEIKKRLEKAIIFFNRISPRRKSNIDLFRDVFFSTYEYQEIPLLEALNNDIGIGFPPGEKYTFKNTFVDDFKVFVSDKNYASNIFELDEISKMINARILEAYKKNEAKIYLDESDFPQKADTWDDLPNTIYGFVKFFYEQKIPKIILNGFGGSSALNLLSRFYGVNSEIDSLIEEIVGKEQELLNECNNSDSKYIIAEIIFNPDQHVSNVLEHPVLFDHFIPILSSPKSINNSTAILLDDLYLSISADHNLILRSKKNNIRVKPVLLNAHNYMDSKLPVYKFLSEFQNYNQRVFLGPIFESQKKLFSYIPRIEYDNIVIYEARWFIQSNKVLIIKNRIKNGEESLGLLKEFQNSHNLPRFVLLVEGDNEFLVDFESDISIQALMTMVKKNHVLELKEFLLIDSLLKNKENRNFSHEFLITFYKNGK